MNISVVISAWTEDRWDALGRAIDSVAAQAPAPAQIVVVVDHNEALLERVRDTHPDVIAIANEERRGLSGARNTGVRASSGEVVAFLDDDARAQAGWLAAMIAAFEDERVVGAGGPVLPDWEAAPPRWLPSEFLWVVGCSYRGQPATAQPIRNPIGANMAFRRTVFDRAGGFSHELARTGGARLVSCDETEFSIRARRAEPGTEIVMAPGMVAEHFVPRERTSWSYFRKRCFGEGFAKALVARSVGADDGLASERSYTLRVLPSGALAGVRAGLRGEPGGFGRAGAIVAGLGITTAGYARGLVAARTQR